MTLLAYLWSRSIPPNWYRHWNSAAPCWRGSACCWCTAAVCRGGAGIRYSPAPPEPANRFCPCCGINNCVPGVTPTVVVPARCQVAAMDEFRNTGIIGRLNSNTVIETIKRQSRYLIDEGYHVIL